MINKGLLSLFLFSHLLSPLAPIQDKALHAMNSKKTISAAEVNQEVKEHKALLEIKGNMEFPTLIIKTPFENKENAKDFLEIRKETDSFIAEPIVEEGELLFELPAEELGESKEIYFHIEQLNEDFEGFLNTLKLYAVDKEGVETLLAPEDYSFEVKEEIPATTPLEKPVEESPEVVERKDSLLEKVTAPFKKSAEPLGVARNGPLDPAEPELSKPDENPEEPEPDVQEPIDGIVNIVIYLKWENKQEDEVLFHVYRNGEFYESITRSNHMSTVFSYTTPMDRDEEGNLYVYKVEQEDLSNKGYQTVIFNPDKDNPDVSDSNIVIQNIYIEKPDNGVDGHQFKPNPKPQELPKTGGSLGSFILFGSSSLLGLGTFKKKNK